jgi:hypothetical protein
MHEKENNKDVRPCPFCGEIPLISKDEGFPPLLECKSDKCLVQPIASGRFSDDTIEELIADWNVRT